MFHIVLSADENYIKFAAVLINSIVKNTNTNKKFKDFCDKKGFKAESNILKDYENINFENLSQDEKSEGYVFHILSNFISEKSRAKLSNLALKLNQFYPCEIEICIIGDEIFRKHSVPLWRGNYQAYYILLIQRALKQSVKTCLVLDVDMLCLGDVREYFAIDLKDKIVGAVLDKTCLNHIIFTPHDKKQANKEVILQKGYINTGMIYVNLDLWKSQKIEEQAFEILKNYSPMLADQCTLSAVLKGRILPLPLKFNYLNFITPRYRNYPYNENEILNALENILIIHLLSPKPWNIFFANINENFKMCFNDRISPYTQHYLNLWWEMALNTPFFEKDLLLLNLELKNEALKKYANDLASKLNENLKTLKEEKYTGAKIRVQNSLSYKIGLEIIKAYKGGTLSLLLLPFTLKKLQKQYLEKKKFKEILTQQLELYFSFKPIKLENMLDFNQAQKAKEHLAFKLGTAFLKAYKTNFKLGLLKFYFEAKKLKNLKQNRHNN